MSAVPTSRMVRRELHRSRAVPTVITAGAVILLVLWVIAEALARLVGGSPLLIAPASLVRGLAGLAPAWQLLIGVVTLLAGLALVALALAPGRRPRRVLEGERVSAVIDDAAIAGLLTKEASSTAALPTSDVHVVLHRRRGVVTLTPPPGHRVDVTHVNEHLQRFITEADITPPLEVVVRLNPARRPR